MTVTESNCPLKPMFKLESFTKTEVPSAVTFVKVILTMSSPNAGKKGIETAMSISISTVKAIRPVETETIGGQGDSRRWTSYTLPSLSIQI